ncbi:FtsL-like putative cell division protein [Aureibacter tunicatorum]|uniref:Cell division protein FtsL n=1 Tax=Aureibacter tunicatorum TaxID=866807 RepID=A0AAE3XT95_9BACT|nr:FtsL-like putative cell division protein [Aureibacter tunicatorum]MDR6241234.1 hypothetical protein [Aureibacter tunicatorum]
MIRNSYRSGKRPARKKKQVSIFGVIEKYVNLDAFFEGGLPVKYLPKIVFISLMGIIYIGNSHMTEKNTRKIDKLQVEVEDLRANYTTLKASYMYASKQSEVAKSVKKMGLKESLVPPVKIQVKKSEY